METKPRGLATVCLHCRKFHSIKEVCPQRCPVVLSHRATLSMRVVPGTLGWPPRDTGPLLLVNLLLPASPAEAPPTTANQWNAELLRLWPNGQGCLSSLPAVWNCQGAARVAGVCCGCGGVAGGAASEESGFGGDGECRRRGSAASAQTGPGASSLEVHGREDTSDANWASRVPAQQVLLFRTWGANQSWGCVFLRKNWI